MIEVIAAALGASATVGAMGIGALINRSRQARDAVVRLTSAVENIAERLERLHVDIRSDRQETLGRLFDMEKRISKLEFNVTIPSQSTHQS
jgi:hypothetical protein